MRKINSLPYLYCFALYGDVAIIKKENDVTKTPQKDVYNLIGKRVTSIDSIVSNKTCRVIFLFNYYDCGSCIDLGFSITKK